MMFYPKNVSIKKYELQKHRMVHQSDILIAVIVVNLHPNIVLIKRHSKETEGSTQERINLCVLFKSQT